MPMITVKTSRNRGFTLAELTVAAAAVAIVIIGVGSALFHAHQSWNYTFDVVHGDMTTDAYAATRAFDAIVRKSSLSNMSPRLANDDRSIELFYCRGQTSTEIDGYARLYLEGDNLMVLYAHLPSGTYSPTGSGSLPSSAVIYRQNVLVHNVQDVKFSVDGPNVRMTLTIHNEGRSMQVVCSATRHAN